MHRTPLGSWCFVLIAALLMGADWPMFRGPHNDGMSSETNVPLEWGKDKNIVWRAKLPGPGNGSPIVIGQRVFVVGARDEGQKRELYCFDRASGRQQWARTVAFDKIMPTHRTNPHGATTPASDGKRIVVWHGSAGLFCYDLDGNEQWKVDLGEFRHQWGYAASPIIAGDRVIQNCAPGKRTFVAAFDLNSGSELWRTEEPIDGDGDKRPDGAPMGTWSTPMVVKIDGRDQILCAHPTRLVAYDPADGRIIWYCQGLRSKKGDLAYSSPVLGDGFCVILGGYNGAGMAVKLGGSAEHPASGDVTATNVLWRKERIPQSIGSGVIVGDYLYVPDAGPETIRCLVARTGEDVWTTRESGGNHWGSILLAEDRMYVTNQEGTTLVFRPNPQKFDLLARNELGEHTNATPAISDGQIFIRTYENLYCIGR
ncbi:MAG TPA: PQQ-binding-like beta-propeller repeat protein [Pirellulales bacterium]|nr:PQQ-binding-like beta-propeller repeat protein [Pirellulales bacterium]